MSKMQSDVNMFEATGMKVVRSHYSALSDTLKTFNVKVSEVLAKAESEFLQAYRAHMVEVHKELQELRGKLAEAESSILKDDYIQQLERDCAWYRNEAAQLTAFVTAMDKDKGYMCRKLRALRNDRQWLSRQLKASKKQHKLLRAELEARVTAGSIDHDLTLGGRASKPTSTSHLANQEVVHARVAGGGVLAPGGGSGGLPRAGALAELDAKLLARNRSAPELGAAEGAAVPLGAAADPDLEWRLRQQIRTAKQLLAREKRTTQELRASIVNERLRQSELEEFFLQCADDVKKENERATRVGSATGGGLTTSGGKGRTSAAVSSGMSVADEIAGPERAGVMRKLLKRKDALSVLFDSIFPPTAAERDAAALEDASRAVTEADTGNAGVENLSSLPLDSSTVEFLRMGATQARIKGA